MSDSKLREQIVRLGRSMFERRLTFGSTGNISVRTEDGWLMTPTGSTLGDLDPARLSRLDLNGRHIDGDPPTKESVLHTGVYAARPQAGAIVHLHATHSVAVSCLHDIDENNVLPPLTAYYVMRIGKLPLVPYFRPGDKALADAVRKYAREHHAMLLANHGPIVSAKALDAAVYSAEELEETAKLYLLLDGRALRPLTEDQIADLHQAFPT